MRRSVLVVPVLAVLLAGAACSQETPGTPTPGGGNTTTAAPPSGGEPSGSPSSTGGGSSLADTKPCDLMPSSAAGELGLKGAGTEQKLGQGRTCRWRIEGASIKDSVTLDVVVFDSLGVADVVGKGEPKPVADIGGHKAVQYTGVADNCVFALEVTESSRVDVMGTGEMQKSCEVAAAAAKLVEPELP